MIGRVVTLAVGVTAAPTGALSAQAATAQVNGVAVPYVVEGSGPALVLIHGWAVNHHFWDGTAGELARHYTVIRYDRRGFGDASGTPDATADAADLRALLEHLGHARVHVVGHSAGAGVALDLAVRHPAMVVGLVLYGPGPIAGMQPPVGEDAPPVIEWIAAGRGYGADSLRAGIARWAGRSFGGPMPPDLTERAWGLLATYSGADLLDPAPPANLTAPVRLAELATVRAPTLIITGELEPGFIQRASGVFASDIPGAERVVIPGGGHVVSWQQPERFMAALLGFLRRVDARR
jgi:pimeloyl-ACP methyl ester carboxylesterase